ncbi:hypothetical protein GYB59_09390 [bacterium]|nr:hypothetical protein [bacterium]
MADTPADARARPAGLVPLAEDGPCSVLYGSTPALVVGGTGLQYFGCDQSNRKMGE